MVKLCLRIAACSNWIVYDTYTPLEVWINRVTKVEVPGQRQLLASKAYLNSSSQTTYSGGKKIDL